MNTHEYETGLLYEFPNPESSFLIIYLEGSGTHSVLGVKQQKKWTELTFTAFIVDNWHSHATIIVPEKPGAYPGTDHTNDLSIYLEYTAENLITHYSTAINTYLKTAQPNTVYLFGLSEGALLLPAIYHQIDKKDTIKKMVIWGGGGLNQKEHFRILGSSDITMPQPYRNACLNIEDVLKKVESKPNSLHDWYLGWPYHRWHSFFNYIPANYYENIFIPALFIHGEKDWNVPVESTKFIEEHFREYPFSFWYLQEMGHLPDKEKEMDYMLQSIWAWLIEDVYPK